MGNDATGVYVFKRIINWTFEIFYLGCYVKSLVLKPKTLKFLQIAAIRHSFRVFAVVVQFPVIPRCFLGSKYEKFYLGCYVKCLVLKTKTLKFCKFLRHIATIRHNFCVFLAVVMQFAVIWKLFFVVLQILPGSKR